MMEEMCAKKGGKTEVKRQKTQSNWTKKRQTWR